MGPGGRVPPGGRVVALPVPPPRSPAAPKASPAPSSSSNGVREEERQKRHEERQRHAGEIIPRQSRDKPPAPPCFRFAGFAASAGQGEREGKGALPKTGGSSERQGLRRRGAWRALFGLRTQCRCALPRPPAVADSCPACAGQSCQRMGFPDGIVGMRDAAGVDNVRASRYICFSPFYAPCHPARKN